MVRKVSDEFNLDDENISKTQRLELDRYQKYLKSIKKYDPMDEEEYLYLTSELSTIINNNEKLSEIEILEFTRKLEKIENTNDYTIELLEITKEIRQIIKPNKKKLEIPKVEKKVNPKKEQTKSLTATSILPKINLIKRKKEAVVEVVKKEAKEPKKEKEVKEEPKKKNCLTLKDIVEKNNKERGTINHFDTQSIKKIRTTIDRTPPKKKKVSKKEKLIWTIIFFASLLCFVFLIIRFIIWEFENISMKNQISDIYALAEVNDVVTSGAITDVSDNVVDIPNAPSTPEPEVNYRPNDYWYYMSMSMLNVDFKELKKINNETAGWIQVSGTNVNYPYVHTKDNKYYLKHSFDKSYNGAGWVFLDYRNDPERFGRNNILYAHGRLDNTMFGSLKKIVTPSWYNNSNNYVIKTSNEKENALWQVFSVYTILPESYYIKTKFNDEEFDTFLNTISSRSVHDFGVDVNVDDKILTLSTCYDETKRVVLHAKLIRIEEK